MSEKAHWMPWYCRDWIADTRMLSCEERGIYFELLNAQWMLGALPNDEEKLQRLACATDKEWRRSWPAIADKLPVGPEGFRRNGKLERIRHKHLGKAASGRRGGNASKSASEPASKMTSEYASNGASEVPAPMPASDIRDQRQIKSSSKTCSSSQGRGRSGTAVQGIGGLVEGVLAGMVPPGQQRIPVGAP